MLPVPKSRLLRFLGGGLGAAGVFFVSLRLYGHAEDIDLSTFDWLELGLLLGLALIYGAANTLLARAWWLQLKLCGLQTEWRWALRTYGLSQLAKYVPGNVFHFAGRQVLGMAAGLAAGPLARSAVCELGSIAIAGTCFIFLALPVISPRFDLHVAILLFSISVVVVYTIATGYVSPKAAVGFLLQVGFLTLSGLVFVAVLFLIIDYSELIPSIPVFCAAYVVAWLVGMVVPGAPAGVGIREASLLFLLDSTIATDTLLLTVVVARLLTVLGDFLFFGVMAALKK